MVTYTINGTSIGAVITSQNGLFAPLDKKDIISVDIPSQNGVMIHDSGRKKKRNISLSIVGTLTQIYNTIAMFNDANGNNKDVVLCRTEDGTSKYWIVSFIGTSSFKIYSTSVVTVTLSLIEQLPVKSVYAASGSSVSFSSAANSGSIQQPLSINWGDGNIETTRAGSHNHTYTDSSTSHIVIIAGVMNEITIGSLTNLTLLYSVTD